MKGGPTLRTLIILFSLAALPVFPTWAQSSETIIEVPARHIAATTTVDKAATGSKVEELFIWKMSDELALTPAEEKKFSELIKNLNRKKSTMTSDLQNQLHRMQSLKTEADQARALVAYKKSLQAYNRLSEEELDKIKAIVGATRTAKYLSVKQDMTNRLKSLLVNPETNADGKTDARVEARPKPTTPPLPPPKLIEE